MARGSLSLSTNVCLNFRPLPPFLPDDFSSDLFVTDMPSRKSKDDMYMRCSLQGLLIEAGSHRGHHRHESSKAVGGYRYALPATLSATSHLTRLVVLEQSTAGRSQYAGAGGKAAAHIKPRRQPGNSLPSGLKALHAEGPTKLMRLLLDAALPGEGHDIPLTSLSLITKPGQVCWYATSSLIPY